MNLQRWINVSVGFSSITFLSYLIVAFTQKILFQKVGEWNRAFEVGCYWFYYIIYSILSYSFYKSSLVEGFYSFGEFFSKIILNVILILTPVLILARRFSAKLIPQKEEIIIIKGENKLDILKIKKSELICISNAQNYAEVFYLENHQLQTKLIRTSLKKLQSEFQFLVQIHRSHLINPTHFKSWKDSSTIQLTQVELPVSKTYKGHLQNL